MSAKILHNVVAHNDKLIRDMSAAPKVKKIQGLYNIIHRNIRTVDDIRQDILHANGQISRLEAAKERTGITAHDVKQLDAEIAGLAQKNAELPRRDPELSEAITNSIALKNACAEWLKARGLPMPADDEGKRESHKPRPLPIDEASAQTLAGIREKIAALRADARRIESAWPPAKLLIAEKNQQIDQLLEPLCRPKYDIASRAHSPEALLLMLVAANQAQLKKYVAARVEEIAPAETYSPEEKAERLQAIAGEITQLEIEEEKLCVDLEAQNFGVVRRGDLSPAVFFEAT